MLGWSAVARTRRDLSNKQFLKDAGYSRFTYPDQSRRNNQLRSIPAPGRTRASMPIRMGTFYG